MLVGEKLGWAQFFVKNSMKFALGLKLGMTQIFDEKGNAIPVTLVEMDPCAVTQIKTKEKDGYESVQIAAVPLKEHKISKSRKKKPYRFLREFKGEMDLKNYKEGDMINTSVFQEGDKITVAGITKGKGFAGAVKKWGFRGKMASHGTKHEQRSIGSVGCRYPQRVIKGKKMAGRMGSERVTFKNLKIVKIDKENNLLAIRGALPGRKGTLLEIKG